MTTPPPVVHLKPVTRTHPILGQVVSGKAVAIREDHLAQAQAEGFEPRSIPEDGRYHPYWPERGPGGRNPCPTCTAMSVALQRIQGGFLHRALLHGLLRHPFYVLTGLGREPEFPEDER